LVQKPALNEQGSSGYIVSPTTNERR
jgi:hypothetical protein